MAFRTVFLYGQSMLLSLVASSLANSPDLEVVHETAWGEVEAHAAISTPDVLIYDLESASTNNIFPLLSKNPNLLLIGLDAEHNRGVLLSGKEANSFTMSKIREIVEGNAPDNVNQEPGLRHRSPWAD